MAPARDSIHSINGLRTGPLWRIEYTRRMINALGVEIYLKDGTHMQERCEAPRGSERSFASEADVAAKFEKLAKHALPDAQMAELRDAILNLEDLKDATEIPRLLSAA